MTMNPTPRKMSTEDNDLIKQFLDNGGKVEQKQFGERSEDIEYTGGFYQRRRKKQEASKGEEDK
jgi:hypothetical protein